MSPLFERAISSGRRLRTGGKAEENATAHEAEALADEGAAMLAQMDERAVALRDDVESVLWFLGATGHAGAERRLLAAVQDADATLLARRDEWDATIAPTPWLERIAALDAGTWWLDLVSLAALRKNTSSASLLGARKAASRLRLRSPSAKDVAQADVVGQEDAPGVVVARMFDGAIDVFAIGLEAFLLVGLRVTGTGIESVSLRGKSGLASASGWWVSLPPDTTGDCELVVRRAGREESLPIELTASR